MSAVALSDEQARAVARRSEPLLLSAAAGSGKTSVLVERFVAAVREDAIVPARILAITFTERAAGELRARVRARLLELGEREAARDTEAAFVGTFHGFCARLLRAHALLAGVDPRFSILDDALAGNLRELAFAAALREFLAGERSGAVDLVAAYGVDRVRTMIEQAYAELRSRSQRAPRLPAARADRASGAGNGGQVGLDGEAARACGLLDELLQAFGSAYERLKRARPAVDFDDLELLALALLQEHAQLRASWAERFELLMVDEFQDTNPRQLAILAALDRENLFTVGDELQSIYGFRHADVSLFRARRAELAVHGRSLRLTRNFRSREALLHVVNEVFSARLADYAPLLAPAPQRADGDGDGERVRAGAHDGGAQAPQGGQRADVETAVELLLTDVRGWEQDAALAESIAAGLPRTQLWRQAEARLLAGRVAELVRGERVRGDEVVVLVRAVGDLEVYERALQLCGLRTLATVGTFWAQEQVCDLVSYLRALANPLDEHALYGALASPLAGCSLDCLALLAEDARASGGGLWRSALSGRLLGALEAADAEALSAFCTRLARERAQAPRHGIDELIVRAIESSGYSQHLLGLDSSERRMANVHKLLRFARRFQATEGRNLRGFLEQVSYLQRAGKPEAEAPVADVEPDAVRLMSVHAAKGLEFPVVCMADLGRQPYTQTPDLLVDGERIGLRLAQLHAGGSSPTLDYEALSDERREREAEEEDRIVYVAMTRARERLLLSGAVDFARWPAPACAREGARPGTVISWLVPALSPELPELARAGQTAVREVAVGSEGVAVRLWLNTPANVPSAIGLPGGAAVQEPVPPIAPAPLSEGAPAPVQERPGEGTPVGGAGEGGAADGEEASAELPAMLSYSSLSELESCGYRYYLERVLGMAEVRPRAALGADGGGLEARARGTLVHRLMETADLARLEAISPAQVAACARDLGLRVGERERVEIAQLLAAAAAAQPAMRMAAARTLRREHPFAFACDEHTPLITGVIDVLADEGDGRYLVLDYKSDRVAADEDLEALVEARYGVQRELYALAVLRTGAACVEVVHWFLERASEQVGERFQAAALEQLEARVRARIESVRARPFSVSSEPHRDLCLTCPGRGSLCSWSEAETLRPAPHTITI